MSEAELFQDEREAGWVRTAFERMNEPPIARNFALYEMLGTIPGFRVRDRAALKGRFIDTLKETEAGSGVWVADSEPDIHDDHSFRVMLALGKDPIGRTVTKWNRCNY